MHDQPKFKDLPRDELSSTTSGAARPVVEDTVARGQLHANEAFETGKEDGKPVVELPMPVTRALLAARPRALRHLLHALPRQHGRGLGMVVQRGFRRPNSFHIDRLREAPAGYFFDVMTNGFGSMADYSAQIPMPRTAGPIAAYIRALQLSQRATLADVPEAERPRLATRPRRRRARRRCRPTQDWTAKHDERAPTLRSREKALM